MSNNRMARPRQPIKYEVGKDIDPAKWEQILLAVTDWFREKRPSLQAPGAEARKKLQECLDGVTADGSPWYAVSDSSLAARIRSKCWYDIETMEPRRTADERTRRKKDRAKVTAEKKTAAKRTDPFMPDEVREVARASFKHGEDPRVFLSESEEAVWHELFEDYATQFPELSTVNARAELESLCDAHILKKRNRARILSGQTVDPDAIALADKQFIDNKKALGIHPDQLIKRIKPKTSLSVAEAILRLSNMEDWKVVRERHWLEELCQFYAMYMTPRADGNGYQLDDVGLFGFTKSRVVSCPKCGHENYAGLTIDEIEAYLIRKGVLTPELHDIVVHKLGDKELNGTNDEESAGDIQAVGPAAEVDGGTTS